ncbi:phosphate ABC transporter permease PstA [Trichocoleus sp. FACHB-262]|uniref:phosphate ABC transporter permease PstA n=1 Tax=Trichocoleus sp. FACHB-262 TaxID=2692869 RepID=UPI001686DCEF|nr:phosphate ABC transporter permease PstA [Trichocoleus sp. FACHB-262]MBD2123514.1 phosphate ABC transporter permease PstA [Trichocoleus sp. FACHB-262]
MSTNSVPTPPPSIEANFVDTLSCPLLLRRVLFSYGMTAIAFSLAGLALLPLLAILGKILAEGVPAFKWEMLVSLPAPAGVVDMPNGFAHAILGTLTMVGLASLLSIPVGILTAIFLVEFKADVAWAKIVRFMTIVLSGVPSIVVGVFAYGVIVLTTRSFSAIAGAFALAVIMLPIVVLTTEEALKLVPVSQRLASAALGGSQLQTTWRVVITSALPGITTGILLAIARAAGETAPLLFTALFSQSWLEGLTSPTPSLSVLIFNYYNEPYPERSQLAWTASLVLLLLVVVTSLISRFLTRSRLKLG